MELSIIKNILNYQFGDKIGDKIINEYKDNIEIEISKNTGRIRRIYINKKLFGTIEPTTGFIILKYYGAYIIKKYLEFPKYRIIVSDDSLEFISKKKSVFCKFVIDLDKNILPNDVVLIVDKNDNLYGTGISILSAKEILQFKRGIAVKIKDARDNNKEI